MRPISPIEIFQGYANRIRDRLVPLRRTEIDGVKFYYSRGNEPQNPREMGIAREMYSALDDLRGEVAIDVGAHIGSYALRLAKRFRKVIAFEPNPFNRHILSLNVQLNKIANIEVEAAALSDRDGLNSFFLHRAADGTGSLDPHHYGFRYDRVIQVMTKPLDSFAFSRIDLLKIDAEGNELPILRGGSNTIERTRPVLAVEVHKARSGSGESCDCDTCKYLRSQNYNINLVGEYTVTPVHWIVALTNDARTKSPNN